MSVAQPAPAQTGAQLRRVAWLHFANDFTLDFITPLLPAGVGVAWIGVMEGLADGIGQALKLVTGRASDRTGRRAVWVRTGYMVNAVARPLAGLGMLLALPLWIILCRIGDRVGKGLRGSATDALVADWTPDGERARAYARMRMMDHLGATAGGLAAALVAWRLAPGDLWMAVCALVVFTLFVAWLARGLRDQPGLAPKADAPAAGWWPQDPALRRPLAVIALAVLATRISPLLILVQVAGLPAEGGSGAWPLWQICLGWAALGLVQAAAAAGAGRMAERWGEIGTLRFGWLAGAAVFAGLAFASGIWLIVAGLAFGVLAGLTEGAEKSWIATLAPKHERAVSFGALALVSAVAALAGNAACGLLLATWGAQIFLVLGGLAVLAALALPRR